MLFILEPVKRLFIVIFMWIYRCLISGRTGFDRQGEVR